MFGIKPRIKKGQTWTHTSPNPFAVIKICEYFVLDVKNGWVAYIETKLLEQYINDKVDFSGYAQSSTIGPFKHNAKLNK